MKKIHIIVQKKDAKESLEQLRKKGMVHIEHFKAPKSKHLDALAEEVRALENLIMFTQPYRKNRKQKLLMDWRPKMKMVNKKIKQHQQLNEELIKCQGWLNQWERWGYFDPKDIKALRDQHGFYLKFYEIPAGEVKLIPQDLAFQKITYDGGLVRCAVIGQYDFTLDHDEIVYPETSLSEMKLHIRRTQRKLRWVDLQLHAAGRYYHAFRIALRHAQEELEFSRVWAGMGRDDDFIYLRGYCPEDMLLKFRAAAQYHQWAFMIEDVGPDDNPPTLLRNPAWVESVKPVLNMINILPGYEELDVSPVFLAFFTLFVGMLVGDAGYGVVCLLIFMAVHVSLKHRPPKHVFPLLYLLSGSITLWGVLTGTYFGQAWLPDTVKPLLPWLNDMPKLQLLCFIIGAVHLSVGHIMRMIKLFPSLGWIKELGWMGVVWIMFIGARYFVVGAEPPAWTPYLGGASLAMIVLFPKPSFDAMLPLQVVNFFTDIVSYIRLFAVGLATVAVADAANQMSIFWVIFLHILNVILAAMAILVHGLRLNLLEFSGHVGLEWSGLKYEPFKKR